MPQSPSDPSLSVWEAQSLRLTVFPSNPQVETKQTWWQDIFGETPEQVISQSKQLIRQEQGPFDASTMTLQLQPARVDWQLTAPLDLAQATEKVPVIENFPDALSKFAVPMSRWLTICPLLKRLAFGAKLVQATKDHDSGYSLLAKYLHSLKIDPSSSELVYQINRPRPSKSGIPKLQINRLSKWALMKVQLHVIVEGEKNVTPAPYYTCSLELDINTTQEFDGDLPQDKYATLFQETIELGKEIAVKGDIP